MKIIDYKKLFDTNNNNNLYKYYITSGICSAML